MKVLAFYEKGKFINENEFSPDARENRMRDTVVKAIKETEDNTVVALIHSTIVGYRVWRVGQIDTVPFYVLTNAIQYAFTDNDEQI